MVYETSLGNGYYISEWGTGSEDSIFQKHCRGRGSLMARKFKSAEEKALAEEISANIQELMHKKGFRQIDLADRTGIARSTMSDYVNGNTVVPIQAIERIARALGTSKAQLLGSEIYLTEADKLESSLVVELKRELEKANQRIAELEAYIKRGVDLL